MNEHMVYNFIEKITEGISDYDLLMISLQGEIAASISTARIEKNMSQKDLAKVLGVSQALVSRWENGESNFTLSTLAKLALALDIPIKSPFSLKEMPRFGEPQYDVVAIAPWLNYTSDCISWHSDDTCKYFPNASKPPVYSATP